MPRRKSITGLLSRSAITFGILASLSSLGKFGIIPFSERKSYRLLKWVGNSLKTLFVLSNQETVRIIVTNIDHL